MGFSQAYALCREKEKGKREKGSEKKCERRGKQLAMEMDIVILLVLLGFCRMYIFSYNFVILAIAYRYLFFIFL